MALTFKTNTADIQKLANQLEKHRKSSIPIAIRNTLNNAAFAMKGVRGKEGTISSNFKKGGLEERRKNFIKVSTSVSPAKGFNVKSMKAIAGVVSPKKGESAGRGLEEHEFGGKSDKHFVALKDARVGARMQGNVKKKYTKHGGFKRPNKIIKGNKRRFIKKAATVGVGGIIHYGDFISEVKSIGRGKNPIKLKMLYKDIRGESYQSKKLSFVRKSAIEQRTKLEQYFVNNAKKILTYRK